MEILFSSLENIDVKFYGWMKEPWEEAYKADLILIPSRFEGVPLIMLEAINLNIIYSTAAIVTGKAIKVSGAGILRPELTKIKGTLS